MQEIVPDETGLIDLPPHQWRSDREKPKEPFFDIGLWPAVAWLIGATVTFTFIHLVVY